MKLGLFLLISALAWAQPTVIQNATVYTVTKGTFKGSVLFEEGKIKAVGKSVAGALHERFGERIGGQAFCRCHHPN